MLSLDEIRRIADLARLELPRPRLLQCSTS
jgi:hypothetical protein